MVNARSLTFDFFSFCDCTPDSGKSLYPSLGTLVAVVAGATTGMSFQSHNQNPTDEVPGLIKRLSDYWYVV